MRCRVVCSFRLNVRLQQSCEGDIPRLCPMTCTDDAGGPFNCGGAVLRCLTENVAEINGTDCQYVCFLQLESVLNEFPIVSLKIWRGLFLD